MTEPKKAKSKGLLIAIWCAGIIGLGVIIFLLLSAFGALRYWQSERTPQGCLLYTSPSPRDRG